MKRYVKPELAFIRLRPEEGIACSGSDTGRNDFNLRPPFSWGNPYGGFFWGGAGNRFDGGSGGRRNRR